MDDSPILTDDPVPVLTSNSIPPAETSANVQVVKIPCFNCEPPMILYEPNDEQYGRYIKDLARKQCQLLQGTGGQRARIRLQVRS